MKITIIAGNGIGGTEKAAYLFAIELANRGHEIHALTNTDNCRIDDLVKAGIVIHDIEYNKEQLIRYIQNHKPDVIHQHTPGYMDHRPLYEALENCGESRPKLIETNVFGVLMDRYDQGHVDMRMFVSMASGSQAFERPMIRQTSPSIEQHSILYNPLPKNVKGQSGEHSDLRASLGISRSDFVFIRVGRPGHKWARWECEAFHKAHKKISNLKLILIEPSKNLQDEIRKGTYGEGIIIIKATSDQKFLNNLYKNSNAMLHASKFGESYGYTLAEAMLHGLPIITRTTPWGDNAQVELIAHGENGYVCCSIEGMVQAIIDCVKSSEKYTKMSKNALTRTNLFSCLNNETDLLEEILYYVKSGIKGPLMQNRFDSWMTYKNDTFHKSEWQVYEKEIGLKFEVIKAKVFSLLAKNLKKIKATTTF